MSDEKQEGQKTIVSFVVGLLIGGLLVWAFSGPTADAPTKNKDEEQKKEMNKNEEKTTDDETVVVNESKKSDEVTPVTKLPVGDGKIVVTDQAAGDSVVLSSATYPVSEGWVGVRDYQDGRLGGILGVVRFSEEQGLVPDGIVVQRSTVSGKEYAIVVYTENGDRKFNLADDVQIDSVFATFTAQ